MRYADAIKFILDLELFGIKMGLDNIVRFLDRLGNPQGSFKSIHIAGTNGKGSVAAMLFYILRAAGYETGLFTSPHLVDFRERIRVGTSPIDKRSIARFVDEHHEFIRETGITFFEFSTALAFSYFREMQADIAVVEVGLGGRLDATNVIKPLLSIITHIDYDHTRILGTSLEQIAAEKAGIIKNSVPLVTGERRKELLDLFRKVSNAKGAVLHRAPRILKRGSVDKGKARFNSPNNGSSQIAFSSSLVGEHQIRNAAIVRKSIDLLNRSGLHVSDSAIRKGFRHCRWPARFQLVSRKPRIILDVAHNPDGARALVKTFQSVYPKARAIVVCGFLERPDFDVMLKEFAKIASRLIITSPQSGRAAEIEGVVWEAMRAGIEFDVRPKVADAVERALALAQTNDIVLICGSHYTVGEAIVKLHRLRDRGELTLLFADITHING